LLAGEGLDVMGAFPLLKRAEDDEAEGAAATDRATGGGADVFFGDGVVINCVASLSSSF